jgi:hypothetical protein
MRDKMRYWYDSAAEKRYCEQIIMQQPVLQKDRDFKYISRLWKRVEFDETSTPIDLELLEKYITEKKDFLAANLSPNRHETMLLLIKYLLGDFKNSGYDRLKELIHDYRISTLRHLNYSGFGLPPEGFTDLTVDKGFMM